MCDGCSILHFHFLRSQPIYKKAWPALRAVSVFTVRIDFFFFCFKNTFQSITISCFAGAVLCVQPAYIAASIHPASRHSRSRRVWRLSPVWGCVGANPRVPSPARLYRQRNACLRVVLSPSTGCAVAALAGPFPNLL